MEPKVILRTATDADSAALSRLAMISKAYWGYDADFMQACIPALTITPEFLAHHHVVLAEYQWVGTPKTLGFYALSKDRPEAAIEHCFVDPAWIGKGIGTLLWRDMKCYALSEAITGLTVTADPNAAGFYRRMGMTDAGTEPSDIFGPQRQLPVLKETLTAPNGQKK
jgi:GNAT superfamily N-acetyltransferase